MKTFIQYEIGDVLKDKDGGLKLIVLRTTAKDEYNEPVLLLGLNSGLFVRFTKDYLESNFEFFRNEKEWVFDKGDKMAAEMLAILNGNKIEKGE